MTRASALAALAMILAAAPCLAGYPRIKSLGSDDLLFRQFESQVQEAYRDESSGKPGGPAAPAGSSWELGIYAFALPAETDIFALAAKLNLPYESIATLNRLPGPGPYSPGKEFLIPSRPGVFLPAVPRSDLELLLSSGRSGERAGAGLPGRRVDLGEGGAFFFFPADRFSPEERAFFLNGLFRFPLPAGTVSSGFGFRVSPISGKVAMHPGVDLAAPAGTEVYASRAGSVQSAGWDETLGNYVVLDHGDGYTSVYGHLSSVSVSLRQTVKSGTIIGRVGSTGKSTGPHLHFEIRSRGEAKNPESFIPRTKK
jgi:murein DD-endopeptidase MepM/ murein hydrolase activator NlpD